MKGPQQENVCDCKRTDKEAHLWYTVRAKRGGPSLVAATSTRLYRWVSGGSPMACSSPRAARASLTRPSLMNISIMVTWMARSRGMPSPFICPYTSTARSVSPHFTAACSKALYACTHDVNHVGAQGLLHRTAR